MSTNRFVQIFTVIIFGSLIILQQYKIGRLEQNVKDLVKATRSNMEAINSLGLSSIDNSESVIAITCKVSVDPDCKANLAPVWNRLEEHKRELKGEK